VQSGGVTFTRVLGLQSQDKPQILRQTAQPLSTGTQEADQFPVMLKDVPAQAMAARTNASGGTRGSNTVYDLKASHKETSSVRAGEHDA
jgi:hypothetical protein